MSLNMHGMVRGAIGSVNSDRPLTFRRNTGYTTAPNGKQIAAYSDSIGGSGQIQALSSSELKHMVNLNIQGIMRKVYLYGDWGGPIRADAVGGDLLSFPRIVGGPVTDWKIVTVFETWTDSGWCAVGVVMQ